MIPINSNDINREYNLLLNELKTYNKELLDKIRILAISKSDLIEKKELKNIMKKIKIIIPTIFISSINNTGIEELKKTVWNKINKNSQNDI